MDGFAGCPFCGKSEAEKVGFTWWGGVLGPKLLNHVKCLGCGKKYNGKTLTKKEIQELIPVPMTGWTELYAKYHQIEPTFFGLGKYMVWIMLAEPKDVKEMEKYAVTELTKLGIAPVCYYSQPFDFGRSIFFRIFAFPDPTNQDLIDKVGAKYNQMFNVAMERYGAIPMRHKVQFSCINQTGGFYDVLTRIKKALDPNNILNRDVGIFQEDG